MNPVPAGLARRLFVVIFYNLLVFFLGGALPALQIRLLYVEYQIDNEASIS